MKTFKLTKTTKGNGPIEAYAPSDEISVSDVDDIQSEAEDLPEGVYLLTVANDEAGSEEEEDDADQDDDEDEDDDDQEAIEEG